MIILKENIVSDQDFIHSFDLNVLGAVRALRLLEEPLKKAQGSVVLFSSIAVETGFANHSVIAVAKGAVEGLVRSLAAEWAPAVRVNAIAPSLTKTGIAQPMTGSEQMASAIAKMHPLQRLGEAEDIATSAKFLMTPDQWITGQAIHVDGGRSTIAGKG